MSKEARQVVRCKVLKVEDADGSLQQLEELGIDTKEKEQDNYVWSDCVIILDKVEMFDRTSIGQVDTDKLTTVGMASGKDIIIDVPFEKFEDAYFAYKLDQLKA